MAKTKKTKKVEVEPVEVAPKIQATMKLLGVFHKAEGETVAEALNNLEIPMARGIGILTLEKEGKKRERVLNARIINGIFGQRSPSMKNIAMKQIVSLFEDFK